MRINKNTLFLSIGFFCIFATCHSLERFITGYFQTNPIADGFTVLLVVYITFMIVNPFAAIPVERYGAKNCMLVGGVFYTLFAFAISSSIVWFIYLSAFLVGIAAAILWNGNSTYLILVSDDEAKKNNGQSEYGKNAGFFLSAYPIGSILGMTAMGYLIKSYAYVSIFFVYAFFPLIGFLALTQIKDIRKSNGNGSIRNGFKKVLKALKSLTCLRIGLIWLISFYIYGLIFGIVPIHIKEIMGVEYVGLLSSIYYIAAILLAYWWGRLADFTNLKINGRKLNLAIYFVLINLGLISFYFANSGVLLILGMIFIALSFSNIRATLQGVLGDITTKGEDGNLEYVNALFWFMMNLGASLALLISKNFQDKIVYIISMCIIILFILVVAPLLVLDFSMIKNRIESEFK